MAKKVTMEALRTQTYNGKKIVPGTQFEVREQDVFLLAGLKRARLYSTPETVEAARSDAATQQKVLVPRGTPLGTEEVEAVKPKRTTYRRRDMVAEGASAAAVSPSHAVGAITTEDMKPEKAEGSA